MNEKIRKIIFVLFFAVIFLLISGCGERTTVLTQYAEDDRGDGTGEIEIYSLQIVAFSFDSSNPESPVTVRWEAEGDFPEGFMLAWSPDNPAPLPGQHGWVPIMEDDIREIHVKINDKVPHYFRLCRVKDGACSGFSDTIQVVFPETASNDEIIDQTSQQTEREVTRTKEAEATPTATALPAGSVTLTAIDTDEKGIVTVQWTLDGAAPQGFRVIWSGHTNTPTYPESESKWLKNEDARSLSIGGFLPGIEYHYRVCIVDGGDCLTYSNIISYLVPETATPTPKPTKTATPTPIGGGAPFLSIKSLVETEPGTVKIQWQKTGSFPNGYRILWVEGTAKPTYPGSEQAVVSQEATTSAFVKNLTAGKTYTFRMCRIVSGGCDTYSEVKKITLSDGNGGTDSLVLQSVSSYDDDAVKVEWTASGSFPNGFKVVYSSSNPTPVYPGDSYKYLNDSTARNTVVSGLTQGTKYYFCVCKFVSGSCVLYSNVKTITLPITETKTPTPDASSISLNPIIDEGSGSVTVKWIAEGSFPQGFKVVWSDVVNQPTFPENDWYRVSSPSDRTATIAGFESGKTYYFRVCRYLDGVCDIYSNMRLIAVP
ncbi:MAG TPA: fibronectin type III domain-containing protein [Chloroflexi bacterium]|mgnify:CR=1 FL=1|nr:fibronectin type III domain-containing protein [Chloroflexota bacterium]